MKFNPFRPGSIVTPGMFAGRDNELLTLEKVLFQTKHGNPQHILVSGERGIGKSSLLYYFQLIGTGAIGTPSHQKFKFLTLSIALEPSDDFQSIIKKLGAELAHIAGRYDSLKSGATNTWNFIKRWEVAGIKYNSETSNTQDHQLLDEFCQTLAAVLEDLKDKVEGSLVLIDEADKPPASANLGALSKLFTERLTKLGMHNSTLVLAGVTGILNKLRDSHESSPRIFHTITLDPLTHGDCKNVIQLGLADGKAKTGKLVTIDAEAEDSIASLSEGFPNFVQQFAFCAFDTDTNDVIELADVTNGAFKKDGAFQQLGQKYFSELYFEQIGSDEYRLILRAMADHSDTWVTKEHLKSTTGLKPMTLNNGINALKKRHIILPQPGKQGVYRLPNKSFAVWIKAFTADESSIDQGELELTDDHEGAITFNSTDPSEG
jgi:hypothetical protein